LCEDLAKIWPDSKCYPLERAAAHGHIDMVKCLLLQPPQTGLWDGSGDALVSAARTDSKYISRTIMEFWADQSHENPLTGEEIVDYSARALEAAASMERWRQYDYY
jgi:hypothetical protein